MDEALLVGFVERGKGLGEDVDDAVDRESTLLDVVRERRAFEELHHEEERAVVVATEVENANGVGVFQRGRATRFLLEAGDGLGRGGVLGMQHLDGDGRRHLSVGASEDGAEAAFAELLVDRVAFGQRHLGLALAWGDEREATPGAAA